MLVNSCTFLSSNIDFVDIYFSEYFQSPKTLLLMIQDPKVYVETILEVHHKYNALVLTAFNNDAGFVAALDKVLVQNYSNAIVTHLDG